MGGGKKRSKDRGIWLETIWWDGKGYGWGCVGGTERQAKVGSELYSITQLHDFDLYLATRLLLLLGTRCGTVNETIMYTNGFREGASTLYSAIWDVSWRLHRLTLIWSMLRLKFSWHFYFVHLLNRYSRYILTEWFDILRFLFTQILFVYIMIIIRYILFIFACLHFLKIHFLY